MNILLNLLAYFNSKNFIRSVSIRKILLNAFLTICFLITLSGCNGEAQFTCEWPCFHGPDRTNKSPETGLLKEWPKDGPELLWTASGLGEGFTSVSIGGGLLYTAGLTDNQTYVFVYDYNGKLVWKQPNGKSWSTRMSHASSYIGPRSTATFDNGILYHPGDMGRLAAFNAQTGEEIWSNTEIPGVEGYTSMILMEFGGYYQIIGSS